MSARKVGLIGFGPMGAGLAANLTAKGYDVAAWDRDEATRTEQLAPDGAKSIRFCESLGSLVWAMEKPRSILLSIPSGPPVDQVLDELLPRLSSGDLIADCGNSHFQDTARRARRMKSEKIGYLGLGVSGGPDGARRGPSIMAGGDEEAWRRLRPALDAIAAEIDGIPCCGYLGKEGAGHFVKMVHNGIEYSIMHLLMEAYEILRRSFGLNDESMVDALGAINSGLTASYLTKLTAAVVLERAPGEDISLVDVVEDAAGQKGTGQWSVITALEQGVSVPTLAEAVMYRLLSTKFNFGSSSLQSEHAAQNLGMGSISNLRDALTLAFLSAFAQGLTILDSCEGSLGQTLDKREILRTWRGGCILQGNMVEFLWQGACEGEERADCLSWKAMFPLIQMSLASLRSVVAASSLAGIPCPGFSSALAYIESRTSSRLPTAILQLQRDYFGQHGIRDKRTGRPIVVPWNKSAAEI